MTAAILSQDLLAMFLLAAEGDLEASLEDVLTVLEEFQESNDRHFGIARNDLRNLLFLEFSWGYLSQFERSGGQREGRPLRDVRLGEVGPFILRHFDAYFNDESEYFFPARPDEDDDLLLLWYEYDAAAYIHKVRLKEAMRDLLTGETLPDRQTVVRFLAHHGVDQALLLHCSRTGEHS
jgi:hypothetical protein